MQMNKVKSVLFSSLVVFGVLFAQAASADLTDHNNALIDAATLKRAMDGGLLNCDDCIRKVVLLDATDPTSYAAGHIPGAQLWDVAEQVQTRVEGPAPAVNMVLDGPSMDAMIQKHGIDTNTIIVITSSKTETYFPSRTYFLFRYWGFPKSSIKVLDGYNSAWDPADLTSEPTVVNPSTYSVKDRGVFLPSERIALNELIRAVRLGRGLPVDMRGDKSAEGSTPGVFSDVPGDYGVFEGTIKGGKNFVWKNFNIDYDNGDFRFKSAAEIKSLLNAAGIDNTQVIYSYCRTGYIGSVGYFVLDGILGWEVMTYDGSWSQWGKMSDMTSRGGELPAGSWWATDNYTLMDVINYNADAGLVIETLQFDADAHAKYPSPADPCANQVEIEDARYLGLAERIDQYCAQ